MSVQFLVLATTEQLTEARGWIDDCEWADVESASQLTDTEVIRGIHQHYAGGWNQFITDGMS